MNIAKYIPKTANGGIILPQIYGLLIVLLLIAVLSLAFSTIIQLTPLSESYLRPAGVIISVIALFIGGYIAGRKGQNMGLLRGLIIGILYFLVLSLLAWKSGLNPLMLFSKAGYIMLSAAIGGVCGIK
ncbi:MAG: TIGR04086 family membrane protein [Clostridiales bacterium]